jgi:hypothetical protein
LFYTRKVQKLRIPVKTSTDSDPCRPLRSEATLVE